ncbi:hypothetical protein GALL_548380 [mine drainage metagenome]|uniref:Uncharacterized protein n=1 Tax=mine drainage metagenome TaxID=410659 RepID=A0A1J5P834_9ZZZZ
MLATRNSTSAVECLRIVARRDLPAFHGLAQRTKLDDVAAVFDLDRSWRGEGVLGSERRRASWLRASALGFGQGVRVWADDDDVLLLDAPEIELPDRRVGVMMVFRTFKHVAYALILSADEPVEVADRFTQP